MKQVIEFNPSKSRSRYFIVDDEKFSRFDKTSFYWFRQRELKRAYPNNVVDWFAHALKTTHCVYISSLANANFPYEIEKEFDNLLDFYSYIGYDRIKKKYV